MWVQVPSDGRARAPQGSDLPAWEQEGPALPIPGLARVRRCPKPLNAEKSASGANPRLLQSPSLRWEVTTGDTQPGPPDSDSHLCALTGTRPALPKQAQRCMFTSVEAPSLPEQLFQSSSTGRAETCLLETSTTCPHDCSLWTHPPLADPPRV